MNTAENYEVSKWDVALEAMAREEFERKGDGLNLKDFRRLARQYTIRLDDIMVTLFELAIHGQWQYTDLNGIAMDMERETLDNLYVNRRLTEADLDLFTGTWRPRP